MNRKTTLRGRVLGEVQAGEAMGHLNLTLVPLRGERHGHLDYMLSTEALSAGTLTITEVSQGGRVPELLADNKGQRMLLLLDGEELIGAKQNRILNTSVLLPGHSQTRIPVSCVEQGRWRHVSASFSSGSYSPAKLRALKSRDVSRNLATTGEARSDQGRVWEEVSFSMRAAAVPSPTMAMHDVVEQRRDVLGGFVQALEYPAGARGIAVAINGRFAAMDLFDKPATLQSVWARLITGYAMDAIGGGRGHDEARQFTRNGAAALLEHLAELECRAFPSVGLGEDWRFEAPDILGQALVVVDQPTGDQPPTSRPADAPGQDRHDTCVHLSVFPNVLQEGSDRPMPGIMPPSRRRPRRRDDADGRTI